MRLLIKLLPWALLVILGVFFYLSNNPMTVIKGETRSHTSSVLTEVQALGKLELVNYNFQQLTEFEKEGDMVDLKIFKIPINNEGRALLISYGNAVGCIDLTLIQNEDVQSFNDTLYVTLPAPEICYFKIDLERSKIYNLETKYLSDDERKEFITEMYEKAEAEIKASAYNTNILEQTRQNATLIMEPVLRRISDQPVQIRFALEEESVNSLGL